MHIIIIPTALYVHIVTICTYYSVFAYISNS